MKKQKFAGLNFDSIQMLSAAEQAKVKGGYGGTGGGGFCPAKTCSYRYYDMGGAGWQNVSGAACTVTGTPPDCLYVCPGTGTCF